MVDAVKVSLSWEAVSMFADDILMSDKGSLE